MREVMTDKARLCIGEMKETCEESGIQLNTSVRYSLESNGVAERTTGVLTSAVQPMLHDSGPPKFAATYVHNRMPTKALGDCTPYEVLSTMERNQMFRISAHLGRRPPSSSRKNCLPSRMCVFVGFEYSGRGGGPYRAWDPKLSSSPALLTARLRPPSTLMDFASHRTTPTIQSSDQFPTIPTSYRRCKIHPCRLNCWRRRT